jgi:predicted ABC-type transport system involved in lysophospholipase L1 biosynthesis ATPase subunit
MTEIDWGASTSAKSSLDALVDDLSRNARASTAVTSKAHMLMLDGNANLRQGGIGVFYQSINHYRSNNFTER